MTEERLQFLLAAYGADPHRWPEAERNTGRAMLAAAPSLRALAEEARDLDRLLDTWKSPAPDMAVQARLTAGILARAKMTPQQRASVPLAAIPVYRGETGWLGWVRPLWPNFVGLAASAGLGLFVGWYEIDASADELSDEVFGEMTVEEDWTR